MNTSKASQYERIKDTGDRYDAVWLAQQMGLGISPTEHIYPTERRVVHDFLRIAPAFSRECSPAVHAA
ncbi:hypothetical protein [Steroidobacter gossypii]|uniref:hypothetical protein n=1 Tax=Steroidobacter gossypii TaxID=2805490 RepID=UPI001C3FA700|nr:hypothetical protein [Steroidobacter gossypii]